MQEDTEPRAGAPGGSAQTGNEQGESAIADAPPAASNPAPPPAAPAWMNDPTRLAEFAERLAACGTRAFRHPAGLELTFEAGRKAAPAGDSGRW